MGHLACSQACNTIQTHNKQRIGKHTTLRELKQRKEPGDWMTGKEGWSLRWRVYLSQLSRFTTCRINKNFNLFDLTCCCLKVQPEILVQRSLHSLFFHINVGTGYCIVVPQTCFPDLLFKASWLGKGFCHWSDPCQLKVEPLSLCIITPSCSHDKAHAKTLRFFSSAEEVLCLLFLYV